MNLLFENFQTDANLEVEGKWVYPAGEPTESNPNPPAFKIARAGGANKRFTKAQNSLMKPHLAVFRNTKEITQERLDILADVAKKCFFDTVLLDWKNVKNAKNEPVEFSRVNAEDLMKQLPALYEYLMAEAQSLSTFNTVAVADEAGN